MIGLPSVLFRVSAVTTIAVSAAAPVTVPANAAPAAVLGIDVADLPSSYPHRFRVPGVYVTRVAPDSPAEAAHMFPGDIVTQIHGMPVNDMAGYRTANATLTTSGVTAVAIRRYGRALTLTAAPIAPGMLYAKAPSCEPESTNAELGAAGVSARRRDFENQRAHGAKALDFAETCASLEAKDDGTTLMRAADALSAMAAGAAGLTERDSADAYYGDAWDVRDRRRQRRCRERCATCARPRSPLRMERTPSSIARSFP